VRPPSGTQLEIAHGNHRVTVVEVGGGLRTYAFGGQDVLDGYGLDEMCTGGRGQVLMPWPNRIADGSYDAGDGHQQLALTEPSARNAIHGLVRWAAWIVTSQATDRVTVEHQLHPQPGYPFQLDLSIEYVLDDTGLTVRTRARNAGRTRCPFGSGAHPYLTVGTAAVDDVIVQVPGATHLVADGRGIPSGSETVEGTPFDLRSPRRIGSLVLDAGYTDLARDEDGRAWTHLSTPDGDRRVGLWVDKAYAYLMVFTGDTLGERARSALAVEPMSCAPDAFNSGEGLILLEPGDTFVGTWGIVPRVET
jgi:aldose 1-epimerase